MYEDGKSSQELVQRQPRFHSPWKDVWNDWAKQGYAPQPNAKGVSPIREAWFSLKYQRTGQAVDGYRIQKCPDTQHLHRILEWTDSAFSQLLRQGFHTLYHGYSRHGQQQTICSQAHLQRCAVSALLFFPSVDPSLFAGGNRFHALGIDDRIARLLLAPSIFSRLGHQMLQNLIP